MASSGIALLSRLGALGHPGLDTVAAACDNLFSSAKETWPLRRYALDSDRSQCASVVYASRSSQRFLKDQSVSHRHMIRVLYTHADRS